MKITEEELVAIHSDITESMIRDYGAEKIEHVDNLGEEAVMAIISGEYDNVEPWVKEIVVEFSSRVANHPLIKIQLN